MSAPMPLPPKGGRENKLSAEKLADIQNPHELSLSPDGRYVVYTLRPIAKREKQEVSSLWIAQVGFQNSARRLTYGENKDERPRWSPKGDLIAFVSDRAKHGTSSAIYTIPVTSVVREDAELEAEGMARQDPAPISSPGNKKAISCLAFSPDGRFIAFLSSDEGSDHDDPIIYHSRWAYNRLRCVDVATGAVMTVFKAERHVHGFSWNDESTEIALILQKTPDLNSPHYDGVQFARVNLQNYEVIYLKEFPGLVSEVIWLKNELLFLAGVSPTNSYKPLVVWKLEVEGSKPSQRVAFGEDDTVSNILWTSSSPAVKIQKGLADEICILRQTAFTLYSTVSGIHAWDILSLNENEFVTVVAISSSTSPAEVYSVNGKILTRLSDHGQAVRDLELAEANPIYADAKDGTPLDGILYTPFPLREKPWPTIVMLHGGPYDRDNLHFQVPSGAVWAPWLANAGYAVLSPNYRGSSARGEDFAVTRRGAMGTNDYDDIVSMVRAGVCNGLVDENRLAIGGWSQGGFLSYLAVTRSDLHFRAAVCGAGVSDWDMLTMSSDAPAIESELAGSAPWSSDMQSIRARHGSPIWHLNANIKTPVLILHGEKDERVPPSQAIAFYRGCMHHKIECEMVLYPREGHLIKERLHMIDILKRIRSFYDKHMN